MLRCILLTMGAWSIHTAIAADAVAQNSGPVRLGIPTQASMVAPQASPTPHGYTVSPTPQVRANTVQRTPLVSLGAPLPASMPLASSPSPTPRGRVVRAQSCASLAPCSLTSLRADEIASATFGDFSSAEEPATANASELPLRSTAVLGPPPGINLVSATSLPTQSSLVTLTSGWDEAPLGLRHQPERMARTDRQTHRLGDWLGEPTSPGNEMFNSRAKWQSDHSFDSFTSPVTNPFLFEDPRTLTELRPIFTWQTIPDSNLLYAGGNIYTFTLQGRVALTERLSLTINKLGWTGIYPGQNSVLASTSGFSEIHLGPKYTFWHGNDGKSVMAAGLIFQMPVGSSNVFQDTGTLSLVPYYSVGVRVWRNMHLQNTLGYSLGTDNQRSDFFYNSFHLDYDFCINENFHIVPLVELNWFRYTSNGGARPLPFEGLDVANIGAPVNGSNYLSIAVGSRFKLTERWQFGIATEFPLLGTRFLQNFRMTADLIWRY